ncbi:MAG: hypothetical protein MPJ78_17215 [Hyphomicrobiaceae bacterium]|nr:hypothetical protein [Hyphomicrobiaceae bacterium]
MREFIDIVTSDVSIAGFGVPIIALLFAALLMISAATRNTWWAIGGTCLLMLFSLFLPALDRI